MNIRAELKVVVGPENSVRLEVGSTVVWIGDRGTLSRALARPDQDNDRPRGKRLETMEAEAS